MTTDALDAVQVQKLLAEIAAKDAASRGQARPAEVVYDQEIIPGATVTKGRRNSMISINGQPLPDRVLCWERLTGREKRFSTTLLGRKLGIMAADGRPRYVTEQSQVEAPPMTFIDETCEICLGNSGGVVRKRFTKKMDWRMHMEMFHPREYQAIKEDAQEARAVSAEALLMAIKGMTPTERRTLMGGIDADTSRATGTGEASGRPDPREEQSGAGEVAECAACGWRSRPVRSPGASLRTHQRLHCAGQRAE